MNNRGQTVLEFLLIILIIIIYLTTVIVPMANNAQGAINDTEKVARANNETQKLSNAIEKITLLGEGSRQTIDVFRHALGGDLSWQSFGEKRRRSGKRHMIS